MRVDPDTGEVLDGPPSFRPEPSAPRSADRLRRIVVGVRIALIVAGVAFFVAAPIPAAIVAGIWLGCRISRR